MDDEEAKRRWRYWTVLPLSHHYSSGNTSTSTVQLSLVHIDSVHIWVVSRAQYLHILSPTKPPTLGRGLERKLHFTLLLNIIMSSLCTLDYTSILAILVWWYCKVTFWLVTQFISLDSFPVETRNLSVQSRTYVHVGCVKFHFAPKDWSVDLVEPHLRVTLVYTFLSVFVMWAYRFILNDGQLVCATLC